MPIKYIPFFNPILFLICIEIMIRAKLMRGGIVYVER